MATTNERMPEQRRQQQREVDPPDRAPSAGAGHARGLFQGGVHRLERRVDEQKQYRSGAHRAKDDEPGVRVDVDKRLHAGEDRAQPLVEETDVRRAQEHPGQDPGQLGQKEQEHQQPFEHALARRGRARDAPGEHGGE
jgi:hypothetical protein